VREIVKWDDQPAAVADFPHSFARAYRVAMTEPTGPIYLCYGRPICRKIRSSIL